MKLLVTGATGFVGRHLVPELLARGHMVTAVARDEQRARAFSWFNRVKFLSLDLYRDGERVVERSGLPEALVHLAWPGLPNFTELFHFEDNLPADYRLLKTLVQAGVQHVLVTGTCAEYGMLTGCLHEELPTSPVNAYGLAKDTLRRFLVELQRKMPFALQWARLFYMFGPGQNARSLLAQLDRHIDAGETSFKMSGGQQIRDFSPIGEIVGQLADLMENPICQGVVNVCSGRPISVHQLVLDHLKRRNASIELVLGHYPYPEYEPMAFWGANQKITALRSQRLYGQPDKTV